MMKPYSGLGLALCLRLPEGESIHCNMCPGFYLSPTFIIILRYLRGILQLGPCHAPKVPWSAKPPARDGPQTLETPLPLESL